MVARFSQGRKYELAMSIDRLLRTPSPATISPGSSCTAAIAAPHAPKAATVATPLARRPDHSA